VQLLLPSADKLDVVVVAAITLQDVDEATPLLVVETVLLLSGETSFRQALRVPLHTKTVRPSRLLRVKVKTLLLLAPMLRLIPPSLTPKATPHLALPSSRIFGETDPEYS
jgi:hypothetical protein